MPKIRQTAGLVRSLGRAAGVVLGLFAGCTRISVSPDCPETMEVGDSLTLHANAEDEGAIATFAWSVSPSSAGSLSNPDRADTTFEATQGGPAAIRLQASDGLFVDSAECRLQIDAGGVAVRLTFVPDSPETEDTITLTCTSIGGVDAEDLTIEQEDGPSTTLTPTSDGVSTVSPSEAGQYTFRCVGVDGDGNSSDPDTVEISVRSGRPPRG